MEFILLAICLGVIPGFIAQSKGRSFVAWWLYGAALFIVALPHSLIIKANQDEIERGQIDSGNSKRCPFCAEIIKKQAIVCRFCGRDLPAKPAKTPNSRTHATNDFNQLVEEYNFVKSGADGEAETWWGANDLGTSPSEDHDLYLIIQNGGWHFGSNKSHVAGRIKSIRGYLSLDESSSVKETDHGVIGNNVDSLSIALRTYKWLVSR
jgi:hypothetical protein